MLASFHFPFFHMGSLDIGLPIQSFGVIVALGVLIGAALLRRYAEWHGASDEHIRGITGWITVAGFIGAHVFDVIAYQWKDLMEDPKLFFELWKGISSYGGFIGGAIGFAIYVWWKRLPVRLMADICIVGLLPAFSIGRIGCTVVSDHIGAVVDRGAWYASMAMDYPTDPQHIIGPVHDLLSRLGYDWRTVTDHGTQVLAHVWHARGVEPIVNEHILAWNLGLIEFLYLVPVNLLVLLLAFRKSKPTEDPNKWLGVLNAGVLIVLTGLLYAPVRFGLDFLRPDDTDPRYAGLTFAQWASFLVFGAAAYALVNIIRNGKPAGTIAKTGGDAQRKLKLVLNETPATTLEPEEKKAEIPEAKATVVGKKKSDDDTKDESAED